MKTKYLSQAAVFALGLTLLAVGCKPGDRPLASASSKAPVAAKAAAQAAAMGSSAIRARNGALAVAFSENAVAAMPQDARYRAQLGQSYLLAGRFASSVDSFRDALTLAPTDRAAILGLALAQAALDRGDDARATIAGAAGKLPDADRGLALALAGDASGALALLEPAARASDATPRTRQNLALAYAMAGRWDMARVTAGQDVAPGELDARMAQWAAMARPQSRSDVVASFLGVTPRNDPGMPRQLALNPAPDATQFAAITSPNAPVAEAGAVETALASGEVPAAFVAPTSSRGDTQVGAEPMPMRPPAAEPAPAPAPLLLRAGYEKPSRNSWAVQLGSFATARGSEAAWTKVRGRVRPVANMVPLASVFRTATGARFHRLSVGGIAVRDDAVRLCLQVRRAGGVCFVRPVTDEAPPIRWAALRRPVRVAAS